MLEKLEFMLRQPDGIIRLMAMQNSAQTGTSTLQLALAWTFVGIPLLAGVFQTIVNALQLFR